VTESPGQGHRQRLRERFVNGEEGSRSEVTLLELLLTYAIPQKDVRPLAERLLSAYGSLSSLLDAPLEALCHHEGIKENSAVLIKLVDWIWHSQKTESSSESEMNQVLPESLPKLVPADAETNSLPVILRRTKKKIQRTGTGMFVKAILKEAIQLLPQVPSSESLDETRSFLRGNLHFNAEQTRERYANYITRRMFPEGYADAPLLSFARAFPETRELRDVCFYRFLLSESFEAEIIENLLLPNVGMGWLDRSIIRKYIAEKFPSSKSVVYCGKAIVDALTEGGIAKANRAKIHFAYRDILSASFAFVLHSEFPEPGMYDIRKLEENRLIRAMLWNPERLLHALYELRNRGLVSKISEIDSVRQFTTKYTLAEVVERIVAGGEKI
jgi:DNA repair protein RadC